MAILTLAILSVACSEDGKIAVEFEKTLYTVHGGGSVDIPSSMVVEGLNP